MTLAPLEPWSSSQPPTYSAIEPTSLCNHAREEFVKRTPPSSRKIPIALIPPLAQQGILTLLTQQPARFLSSRNCCTNWTIPIHERPMNKAFRTLAVLLFFAVSIPAALHAQAPPTPSDKPFIVEYYYKTKWGHADEFLKLFKKNHYPLLKKEVEMGRLLKVWMEQPRYHTTEDSSWDFRVTIIFKNATVANQDFDEDAIKKQLYPDQDAYAREEQRRFEILEAHWDLPIKMMDLDTK